MTGLTPLMRSLVDREESRRNVDRVKTEEDGSLRYWERGVNDSLENSEDHEVPKHPLSVSFASSLARSRPRSGDARRRREYFDVGSAYPVCLAQT
jgi:hypothetical protein